MRSNFGRLLDRKVTWLLALENPTGVNAHLTILFNLVGAIADQPAEGHELAPIVDRGHGMERRQRHQLITAGGEEWVRIDEERGDLLTSKRGKGELEIALPCGLRRHAR